MRGDDEQTGPPVQLPVAGATGAGGPSAAGDSRDDGRGPAPPVAAFGELYATMGRPSIPPEHLLRALLLQVLYSVRSERMLMEQLDYNLLFRWFVGLGMDDAVWAPTTFTKNRDRLLDGDIARAFFEDVVAQARGRVCCRPSTSRWMGRCWKRGRARRASGKGQDPPPPDDPGNPTVNFHGERRSNQTHQSTTDPDTRLVKKARDTRPSSRIWAKS